MKVIPTSRSMAVFLDELWFSDAALAADPDAADLAPTFDAAIADWEPVAQRERAARRNVVKSEAVVAVKNNRLDSTTKRFAAVVLVEANGDRKGAFYKRFFREAPSDFIERGLRDQCEQTRDRIVAEIKKLPEASLLRPFADVLLTLSQTALTALDARKKARGDNAVVASDVTDWKDGVNRLRAVTYAELLKRATEKNLGRDWVETFFRREDGASAAGDDEGEPTPPAPTPA